MPNITLLPDKRILTAPEGVTLHALLAKEGLLQAPCGGQGTCGKCRVLVDGQAVLACRRTVDRDMTVTLPRKAASPATALPGKKAAFDIGTTTVVCCLLDGAGNVLSEASANNPQAAYGADVVSRLRAAQSGNRKTLTALIRKTMEALLLQVCSNPEDLEEICVVGNSAMQQLFLGLPTDNLTKIPFEPVLCKLEISDASAIFSVCPKARLLTVPDISGFVGADTVAGILACGLHQAQEMTLLVDIGTNGELVLGNQHRLIACATAAGPALEGAGIQWGMRAESGAIDHVWLEQGSLCCSVIDGGPARGICGSGLVDAVAAVLDLGLLNPRGRILQDDKIMLTDAVYLTQQDIRQVQLAKGAIAAGIRLLARKMGIGLSDIRKVVLAGAFGSHIDPDNACRMGLLPWELKEKTVAVGNAAGQGAILLAADPEKRKICDEIVKNTEFLELAAEPAFPKTFAKAMELPQDWCSSALALGFTASAFFDPAILQAREDVRAMCAQDKCRAYGKNWTCPPHCGTILQCQQRMHSYRRGILLQTVGALSKEIDSRGYREAEKQHMENFNRFCDAIRRTHPDALCLGAGGCRICKSCAFPEACRFPGKAVSSMEGYGLFVTQVCRDVGLEYHHGEKTVTYTACVLY